LPHKSNKHKEVTGPIHVFDEWSSSRSFIAHTKSRDESTRRTGLSFTLCTRSLDPRQADPITTRSRRLDNLIRHPNPVEWLAPLIFINGSEASTWLAKMAMPRGLLEGSPLVGNLPRRNVHRCQIESRAMRRMLDSAVQDTCRVEHWRHKLLTRWVD
jgi:hypothetical protein